MDIVIPCKPSRNNQELRYAIRSFAQNLLFDRIWIIGAKPHWITNVEFIKTRQTGLKYNNTTLALRTACETEEISDDFIYCNDDFFVMRPTPIIPVHHRGRVVDLERVYVKKYGQQAKYVSGMTETRKLLQSLGHQDPISYELHIPMVINKEKMLKVLEIGKHLPVYHKRTAYGNLTALEGSRLRDPKIVSRSSRHLTHDRFLSTSDDSFRYGAVGEYIRSSFPSPSQYEPPVRRTR